MGGEVLQCGGGQLLGPAPGGGLGRPACPVDQPLRHPPRPSEPDTNHVCPLPKTYEMTGRDWEVWPFWPRSAFFSLFFCPRLAIFGHLWHLCMYLSVFGCFWPLLDTFGLSWHWHFCIGLGF